MKIKSLLLGSAAALVAVSGARAADAVVIPEPEAVEYVRVCDAAGAGFFYIPGGETCLKISGYVRYDAGFGELNGQAATAAVPAALVDDPSTPINETVARPARSERWSKNARFSLRTNTWTDTELGALTTYTETRFNFGNNGNANQLTGVNNISLNFAYIDLAGLRIGKSESAFTTFTGYGGSVINDTTGGGYGPFDTNLIQYNYSGGAFSAVLSLEEGVGAWEIDDYVPHVVAGLGYDAGVVNLRAVAGYDTLNNGWAGKIRADVPLGASASAFLMVMYTDATSAYGGWRTNGMNTWSVLGGASATFSPSLAANLQVQWAQRNGGAADVWAVAANVNYTVVPGFVVTPEVQWRQNNAGNDAFGGVVRFQRTF